MSQAADTQKVVKTGDVFVHSATHTCAIKSLCVPCHYKIFPTGAVGSVALPPNQRPEQCPRAKNGPYNGLYQPHHKLLTLGDGDFSFSLSIAKNVKFTTGCLIASSHESKEQLLTTYNAVGIKDILRELDAKKISTLHCVDATDIAGTSSVEKAHFDAIIWNFPCVRAENGADGQLSEIEINRKLLRDFFMNVHEHLLPLTGQLHITHKTIEPFSWWEIVKLAEECGYIHHCSIVFDRCLYPGYVNRKVLDKKSFPLHDARTFVFTKKEEIAVSSKISEKESEIIPVVCTDITLQPDIKLINLSSTKTKKELLISVQKIKDKIENAGNMKINKKYDTTADSSFSSENKRKSKVEDSKVTKKLKGTRYGVH